MLQKKMKCKHIGRNILITYISIILMLVVVGERVIAAERNSVTYDYANEEKTQVKATAYVPSDYAEMYEDHLTIGETLTANDTDYPIVGIASSVLANTKLCSIIIKERDTTFSIGQKAFEKVNVLNLLAKEGAGSITVSCDVDTIGEYAFSNAVVSNSICFEGDVTTIGNYAFEEVTVPGSFNFKGNIDKIGDYAFKNAGVVIVHQFREASTGAFYGTDISELNAIEGMEILGDNAFENCTSLTTVTLADTVTTIGDDCFKGCTSLTSVTLPSNAALTIGENAFPNQEGLVIVVPSEVIDISSYSFNTLTNVVFQVDIDCATSVIQYFEDNGMQYKEGADGEVIKGGNDGTSDDDSGNSSDGDNGTIDGSEDQNDSNEGETGTTTENNGENNTGDNNTATEDKGGEISSGNTQEGGETSSGNTQEGNNASGNQEQAQAQETPQKGKTYTYKNLVYKVTGKSTVTFMKPVDKKVKKISVPAKVEILGQSFKVTKVNKKACYKCKKLTAVTIGNNVTVIGDQAFAKCSKLKKVTIGKGLKKIGKKVFYQDSKLKSLVIKSSKLTSVGKGTLKGVNGLNVQAPPKKVEKYKKLLKKAK